MSNILREINAFLEDTARKTLELSFWTQEILNFHNGKLFNRTIRTDRRLVIRKVADSKLAKITVVDNRVFTFSFRFLKPNDTAFYKGDMLNLPRPLGQGHLEIDPEAQTVVLEFQIEAPYKELSVGVRHVYKDLTGLRKLPSSST